MNTSVLLDETGDRRLIELKRDTVDVEYVKHILKRI